MINIKGHDFQKITIRDAFHRRALQYQNKIISYFRKFGLTEDDVEIPLEKLVMRRAQASVSWYMWNEHLFFSYNQSAKFIENLAMVALVIEYFLNLLSEGKISKGDFINLFVEDSDILKQRKEARELLGVEKDSLDLEAIQKNYKDLSKEHHPDMPTGDVEKFKEINKAHKILKKELSNH